MMKVSDYIVDYLINCGISDVFGYPGGMVTHLMDSLNKYSKFITTHLSGNEQGAALAACGYSQASGSVGVAYATSGPGATNLVTGICNAYFDSIPVLFITGQVNTFESKGKYKIRQRGFQETDVVSIVESVTKIAVKIENANRIKYWLDRAFFTALSGRRGPVLLDIPMDIFRAEINPDELQGYVGKAILTDEISQIYYTIRKELSESKKPVLLLGNWIHNSTLRDKLRKVVNSLGIPVVSSMLAVDVLAGYDRYYGFIGAYGSRAANFIVSKCDLLIVVGARMDVRQVGAVRKNFAPSATILRFDIDKAELEYQVHEDEISFCAYASDVVDVLDKIASENIYKYPHWNIICETINMSLSGLDSQLPNSFIEKLSSFFLDNTIITTDVGQNQVWAAQSLIIKNNQRVFFSGGHGTMGYSLPAAIGACCFTHNVVYCINGDGGFQMNIQELIMISREKLPIKVIIVNNRALGMIRHFQEMYFEKNYFQTVFEGGYNNPDFAMIAKAYNMDYLQVFDLDDLKNHTKCLTDSTSIIVELVINENTYVLPKLRYGCPNQDQEPHIDRDLYRFLDSLDIPKEKQ